MDDSSKYIFLLIGKTGSGKSATGNSILGEKHFVTSDKGVSVTKDISVRTVLRHGLYVTVIDAPGVMDTSVKSDKAKSKSCKEMTTAMSQCPTDGKLAIVLLLKYGDRFTEENKETMFILKNIFGEKNLWKSCIIVMTYGDVFKINNEDDITFESWLRDQEDELGDLFNDCSYRCVLFNNRTKRPEESDQQFLDLVKLTEELDQDYTMTKFSEAKKRQNRLMLEEKLPEIIKDYNEKIETFSLSAKTLSSKDRQYYTLIKSINELNEELNEFDSPEKIYYKEDEPLLFQKQRRDLRSLKADVETKVDLSELELSATKLRNKPLPGNYNWRFRVTQLELPISQWESKIGNNPALCEYQEKLESLQSKLKELLLMIKRHDVIECYTQKISRLTSQLDALPTPSALDTFTPYSLETNNFLSEVAKLNEKMGGLDELLSKIDALQKRIHFKLEDSAVTSGWNRTSAVMGAVSVRTAFIPGVGIPLTIGLNALPLIGRTVHRRYLQYKNNSEQNKKP